LSRWQHAEMAGNVVGVAMVGALHARGSASGDADRSGSARARAGDELEVWGGEAQEGARGKARRRITAHQRPTPRRRRWSTPLLQTPSTQNSVVSQLNSVFVSIPSIHKHVITRTSSRNLEATGQEGRRRCTILSHRRDSRPGAGRRRYARSLAQRIRGLPRHTPASEWKHSARGGDTGHTAHRSLQATPGLSYKL
jgi:hypothetical protein